MSKTKTATHVITHDYRGRWCELPSGQFELKAGDKVFLHPYSGIGSYTVTKEDGTDVSIAGFSGYIISKL